MSFIGLAGGLGLLSFLTIKGLNIFRQADLPRRFLPGAIAFGSVTFTMTSAGSPEIQNLIPMQCLGTKATAA